MKKEKKQKTKNKKDKLRERHLQKKVLLQKFSTVES